MRAHISALFIVHTHPVVLVEHVFAVAAVNPHFQVVLHGNAVVAPLFVHGYNGAFTREYGYFGHITVHAVIAFGIYVARENIRPSAFGYPHVRRSKRGDLVRLFRYGTYQKIAAEHILALRPVRLRAVVGIIHGFAKRAPRGVRHIIFRIKIGNKPVAQTEQGFCHGFRRGRALPRFFAHKLVCGGVQTVDRRKYAELQPADIKFVVLVAEMVSAYVVTPPRITDIGRRRGHIRLEFQARPRHGGIARKSHGIAVAALFCVARQYERALALVLLVQELVVVERPQRVKPGHVAPLALLPVYPPEVHALFFIRAQNIVKIRLHYLFVCERERYALFR